MRAVVVHADAVVRLLLTRILARAGLIARPYATADDALEALTPMPGDIGIVITGVSMRGQLDGLGFARHLRDAQPQLPVIVMSASCDSIREARAIPGLSAVLETPFTVEAMLAAVVDATSTPAQGQPA